MLLHHPISQKVDLFSEKIKVELLCFYSRLERRDWNTEIVLSLIFDGGERISFVFFNILLGSSTYVPVTEWTVKWGKVNFR